jgi:serine protease Do
MSMKMSFIKSICIAGMFALLSGMSLSATGEGDEQKAGGKPMENSPTASIQKMKSAVVQINYSATISGQRNYGVAGTGFLVTNGPFVITNNHVITKTLEALARAGATDVRLSVGLPIPDQVLGKGNVIKASFVGMGFDVVDADTSHDIALLKLGRDPFKGEVKTGIVFADREIPLRVSFARLQPEMPLEGTTLLVSGYPLKIPTLVTQSGIVASQSFQLVEAIVPGSPQGFRMPEVADALLLDAVVNPGNSGGPVYLAKSGAVVGICQGNVPSPIRFQDGDAISVQRGNSSEILQQNAGIAVVIPIRYAIALLKKHSVVYRTV